MPGRPLFCLAREMNTNQKIAIDLSVDGNWLVSGGTDGKVQVWNVSENAQPTVHKQVRNSVLLIQLLIILLVRFVGQKGPNWRLDVFYFFFHIIPVFNKKKHVIIN